MIRLFFLVQFVILAVFLSGCGASQAETVEVTRIVRETQLVTVEVTKIVRQTQIVIVQVTPAVTCNQVTTEQGVSLSVPRVMHTATSLNDGRILVVGGSQGSDQHLASTEIYDPITGIISPGASLNTPRHDHSATLLPDGRVLVVGGYNVSQQWLGDAEIYDPATDTWTVIPPLYSHGVNHTATLMKDGRVLVVGGCIGGGVCTGQVEIFDPTENLWVDAMPLATDRASHTASLLKDGNVLIAGGGSVFDQSKDNEALIYDPFANNWMSAGQMITPRLFAQAARLANGRVLVVGGGNHTNPPIFQPLASAEIYDPATNSWWEASALSEARYEFTMELLPNGQVMVAGGARNVESEWNENSFVREIEIYDPVSDKWRIGEILPSPTAYADSVLLPDGRMWVTGGRTSNAYSEQTWLIQLK